MEESTADGRRSTLTAALARLVPPGAGPGAVEAGAVDYVVRRLARDPGAPSVMAALDLLDRLALDHGGSLFAGLEPTRQDEILHRVAQGSGPEGVQVLRLLVLLALEGSFCHPARGGNHGGTGWKFAGLDTPETHSDLPRCRAS
jgi:hypothetical protein